jgi:two-component system OmpR family response regulator
MRVLVAEDEPTWSAQLCAALTGAGYAVDAALEGRDACYQSEIQAYDAAVLDLGLSVLDRLSVLQRWRSQGQTMPVLSLTARGQWHEKVAGIDAGADDYLTQPLHMEELLARLRAQIRGSQGLASPTLRYGPLTLDTRSSHVSLAGLPVSRTSTRVSDRSDNDGCQSRTLNLRVRDGEHGGFHFSQFGRVDLDETHADIHDRLL